MGGAGGGGARALGAATLGGHHRARLLEPGQGGVDGAERDVGEEAQVLPQLASDLVAVEVALLEEAQDGQVQHDGQYIDSI